MGNALRCVRSAYGELQTPQLQNQVLRALRRPVGQAWSLMMPNHRLPDDTLRATRVSLTRYAPNLQTPCGIGLHAQRIGVPPET